MSLEVLAELEDLLVKRSLCSYPGTPSIETIIIEDQRHVVVLDVRLARAILNSESFISHNFFKRGLEKQIELGENLEAIQRHYEHVILFQEGSNHRQMKSMQTRILASICHRIVEAEDDILLYMENAKADIHSPLQFSHAIVKYCSARVVAELTSISIDDASSVFDQRVSVFFPFYHATRQKRANNCMALLNSFFERTQPGEELWHKYLLAESMLMMGYEPIVGAICASIVDPDRDPFENTNIYCPVSHTKRKCTHACTLRGHEFEQGDLIYLALLPCEAELELDSEDSASKLPNLMFGSGKHSCSGRKLTTTIVAIAERAWKQSYSHLPRHGLKLHTEGVFLSFKEKCPNDPSSIN